MNKYNNKDGAYLGASIGFTGIIIVVLFLMFCSCGVQERIPVISEDGTNWYTHVEPKKVIAKDRDNYYYLVALEDGTTYYATFGEWSLIKIDDLIQFNRKQTKIINIIKPTK